MCLKPLGSRVHSTGKLTRILVVTKRGHSVFAPQTWFCLTNSTHQPTPMSRGPYDIMIIITICKAVKESITSVLASGKVASGKMASGKMARQSG